jgi:hypothetical protein
MGLVAEGGNIRFDEQVAYIEIGVNRDEGLEAYPMKLMALLRRYMPKMPLSFRNKGHSAEEAVIAPPAIYDMDFTFTLRAQDSTASPETRFKRAQATLEQMKMCPFVMVSPLDTDESLIEKVARMWRGYRDLLQAMGKRNVEAIIGNEPQSYEEAIAVAAVINPQAAAAILAAKAQSQSPSPVMGVPAPGAGGLGGGKPTGFGSPAAGGQRQSLT